MKRAPSQSRKGGATVLVLLLLGALLSVAFWVMAHVKESIIWRKGLYATEAAARAGLYRLEPMEYTHPTLDAPTSDAAVLETLNKVAEANGLFPELFEPISGTDVVRGPISLSVLARPFDTGVSPPVSDVYGIPSVRMLYGRQWLDENGLVIGSTGCLPIGIQIADIPDLDSPDPFTLVFGTTTSSVSVVAWTGSSQPLTHIEFLGFALNGTPEGLAPPGLKVQDLVNRLVASPDEFTSIQSRFTGRSAVVPLLNGNQVIRFARIYILSLANGAGGDEIMLRLAPSAVVRAAGSSIPPLAGPPVAQANVPIHGMVLRPWRSL
ncbi:MAG: hypothetical protein ACI9TH_003102 [Kiritimatiellia bacterium]|jgi:hypothetical protein